MTDEHGCAICYHPLDKCSHCDHITAEQDAARLRAALEKVHDECSMAASLGMTVSVRQLRTWQDVTRAALASPDTETR